VVVLAVAATLLAGSAVAAPWIVQRVSGGPTAVGGPLRGPRGVPGMMGGGTAGGIGPGMAGGGSGMMGGGSGMASGRVWLAGDGVTVTSIAAARSRAALASSSAGLHPGEVIQFSDNFYVELKDAAGAPVTEVLVDPVTGAVSTEPGPAMMWNTGSRTASVSSEQAKAIAGRWLRANRSGESVGAIDAYPGYYTVDTTSGTAGGTTGGSTPVGMLSVNATTGAVWYHTWHGTYIAEQDA
jgi:hypothetical protein